jgi:hypothetical protein
MPQKIENKDIFSQDFLEPQKKSFKEIIELIKLMESEMKDVLKVQQQLVKTSDKKSVEGLKKRQRAVQSVNQVSKEMLKLEKQRKVASSQLQLAETKEAKAVAATRIELARKKKAVKQEILAEKGLVSEYQKQSATLNNLRKKYKDLILVQGKETRATRKLRREITTLDKRLKKVDAATGQFQRSVGNYGKAFGKVSGVLRSFGLAVGGLAIVRNITKIFTGFEQGSANLASVLGKTRKEITALTDDAKRLGGITSFTAKEVLQLQTEFAKLGFKEQEILDATEATLSLAAATGTELSEAAAVAGATLGGFGLNADETQRVVDVMAKSFSTSALDMEKFKESMKGAAPAARAIGLSVEKTTALLGTLASAGISGSKAGNNLKTSFINLNKAGLTLEEGLEKVANSEDKLGTASKLVGKNAAASFLVLAEGVETTEELENGLNNAGGAAETMANEQLDTLTGRTKLLTSAWEGFILSLEDGEGIFAQVANTVVEGITNMLNNMANLGKSEKQLREDLKRTREEIGSKSGLTIIDRYLEFQKLSNKELEKIVKLNKEGAGSAEKELELRKLSLTDRQKQIAIQINYTRFLRVSIDQAKKELELRRKTGKFIGNEALVRKIEVETGAKNRLKEEAFLKLKQATQEELIALSEGAAKIGKENLVSNKLIIAFAKKELQRRKDIGELKEEGLKNDKNTTDENQKQNEELKKQNELLKKRNKLKKDAFDATKIIGEQEQEQLKESIKLQEIAADKELALQLEIAANKPEEVNVDELERLLNERFDLIKRALEDERDLLLLNEDLTTEERELINIKFNNKLAENERNRVKTVDDANNEIIDAQIKTVDKLADINKNADADADAKRKKQQQDQLNALKQFSQKAIEISNAKTDKEIENTNKEIEASKTRQSELQQLAAQGNLTAEQSVSAEIKRELELERQKEALEKKKARRQIIIEGLDLLSSKIDGGEKDAVTSTLNDMTRLLGALAALPGFIDGTETTVGEALGKPQLNTGTDDYIVRVDGKEKILNPAMSARTGNMTTEEITRAAEMYSSGMFDQNVLIHPQVAALNQPFQNSNEILKKFDSLESTIRNKPILSDLKFDDLQKALVVTVEQNGDLKRAHYKLK